MGGWIEDEWSWGLLWNRDLRGRELDQLASLFDIIGNVQMIAGKTDTWKWKAAASGSFSVKTAYNSLSVAAGRCIRSTFGFEWQQIWKAPASFKAITTAWKVLKQRMATSDNLQKRHVAITSSEAICILCKLKEESIEHLFFECQKSVEIWNENLKWIGKQAVNQHTAKEHFSAFTNLGRKEDTSFLTCVWICTIWCLWKQRNGCKFNQDLWSKDKVVAEIKSRLWSWRMAFTSISSAMVFRQWCAAVNLSDRG
ncbi:uncharacterized protein LOC130998280 [Salvia miltiorrhiza]|uniref:uncharacterized protein LOC130998280 n=1 Tax=Salvia miltiorrhiza TaxID=226208 RepID=UPI0025ACB141|nr:uncharacterized protein LOC130998280 [Salvia miltiorrhiza]